MAQRTNASGEFAIHNIALVAGAEDVVQFGDDFDSVEVTVLSGTDPIYFSVDNSPATVEGKHTFRVPGVPDASLQVEVPTSGNTVVRLISAGADHYSIIGG